MFLVVNCHPATVTYFGQRSFSQQAMKGLMLPPPVPRPRSPSPTPTITKRSYRATVHSDSESSGSSSAKSDPTTPSHYSQLHDTPRASPRPTKRRKTHSTHVHRPTRNQFDHFVGSVRTSAELGRDIAMYMAMASESEMEEDPMSVGLPQEQAGSLFSPLQP